jgi:hypothetical protein
MATWPARFYQDARARSTTFADPAERALMSWVERPNVTERLLELLRPYGSRWSGALARGDLVIPQREIPKLVREIADLTLEAADRQEAPDLDVFNALVDARRHSSLQDQVAELRRHFRILHRPD